MVSSASHPCPDMGDCNASGSAALPAMQPLGPMAAGDLDAELDIDDFFDAAFPAVLAFAPRRAGAVADALDAEIEEALAEASPDAAALCRGGAGAPGAAATSGGQADGPVAALRHRGADAPGGKSPPSPPASPLQEPPSPDLSEERAQAIEGAGKSLDLELEQAGLGAPADGAALRHDGPGVPDGAALH